LLIQVGEGKISSSKS